MEIPICSTDSGIRNRLQSKSCVFSTCFENDEKALLGSILPVNVLLDRNLRIKEVSQLYAVLES